ncbi:MAG: hypothetical protein COA45_02170 [Zetaproteobacteria bacterium]|nr:MAG: hypothetical protein COA45_02170 [Zetaproteobacteria bacterium]
MSIVDKFSFALNKGFNKLCQTSEVFGDLDNGLSASVSYFSINRDGHGGVDVAKEFGFQIIREPDIPVHRDAYKKVGDPAYLDMLDKVENVFQRIRSGECSLDETNEALLQETENFYQRYISGETITQTYNPMARNFISNEPENPDDKFMHQRSLQKWDEQIGKENEIPHERIRHSWGLD